MTKPLKTIVMADENKETPLKKLMIIVAKGSIEDIYAGLVMANGAVMEGIVFELRWIIESVREAGLESKELRMVGGPAASPVWPKIVADITHLPVVIPSTTEAASCGAAILAGVGSGVFTDPGEGYSSMSRQETLLEPDQDNVRRYDDLFDIYRNVSQQTRDSLSRLSSFDAVE